MRNHFLTNDSENGQNISVLSLFMINHYRRKDTNRVFLNISIVN
jgi:hypothetical protein